MNKYWAHIVISNTEEWEGDVYKAEEVDEVIMNMVNEFAETAKEYESDRAKDKEEIASLKSAYVALEIKYESMRLSLKQSDEEIARLIKEKDRWREKYLEQIEDNYGRAARDNEALVEKEGE